MGGRRVNHVEEYFTYIVRNSKNIPIKLKSRDPIRIKQANGELMFVIVETFLNPGEPSDAAYRVRPIHGQAFSTSMRVQCSRAMRKAFPLGSKFQLPVELVKNKTGGQFLREFAKETWTPLVELRRSHQGIPTNEEARLSSYIEDMPS